MIYFSEIGLILIIIQVSKMNQEYEETEEDFIFYKQKHPDEPIKENVQNVIPDEKNLLDSKIDTKPLQRSMEPKIDDDIEPIELNIEDNPDYDDSLSEKLDPSGLRRVIRDTPIAELTIRKYEMPYEENKRELLKKFCLSLGLLQPGDSRDIIVDVLHVLMQARKEKKPLDSEEIRLLVIEERKKLNLPLLGIASSNIRRQIKRLRDLFIVEKIKNEYIITEFASLENIFHDKIEGYLLPSILLRLKEYLRVIDKKFG
jgi:hypothetical protein